MSRTRAYISVSLDGYVAGPNETIEEPLGEGGERLHDWATRLRSWRERGSSTASGRTCRWSWSGSSMRRA